MFTEWFGMHYGAGIGVGIVQPARSSAPATPAARRQTRAISTPVPPGWRSSCTNASCSLTHSSARCTPGPDDPTNPHRFADPNVPPVLPIVNLVVGFDFRLPQVRGWEGKIEGGFYNAFFLGGGVGYTF